MIPIVMVMPTEEAWPEEATRGGATDGVAVPRVDAWCEAGEAGQCTAWRRWRRSSPPVGPWPGCCRGRAGQVALARLVSKPYGRWLLAGLPPAPLVRTVVDVAAFCTRRGQGDV